MKPAQVFSSSAALASLFVFAGCGGRQSGGLAPVPTPQVMAPAIVQQPTAQSVPMGRSATYSVTATGTSLSYQWSRNGTPISGASSNGYATAPTAFADSGATYTVTVSNPGGSVTSVAASLTVTARAPLEGDLRFQQVDADSTLNGYGNAEVGMSTALDGRMGMYFSPSVGTSFYVGPGNCVNPPSNDGVGCAWFFSEFPLASSGLIAAYGADFYDYFSQDLVSTEWMGTTSNLAPMSSHSVIKSLDLEPANVLFAIAWVQDPAHDGFVAVQQTIAPADLQAAAAAEGAAGRVITALSHNGGQLTYFAYSWQSDTASIYETQIASGTAAAAPGLAANLAAAGYIITATGIADDNGTVLLVGTRVQGDTMPRPFIAAQGNMPVRDMQSRGYAIVGVIFNPTGTLHATYLGER
jgi:hypothetical protein